MIFFNRVFFIYFVYRLNIKYKYLKKKNYTYIIISFILLSIKEDFSNKFYFYGKKKKFRDEINVHSKILYLTTSYICGK